MSGGHGAARRCGSPSCWVCGSAAPPLGAPTAGCRDADGAAPAVPELDPAMRQLAAELSVTHTALTLSRRELARVTRALDAARAEVARLAGAAAPVPRTSVVDGAAVGAFLDHARAPSPNTDPPCVPTDLFVPGWLTPEQQEGALALGRHVAAQQRAAHAAGQCACVVAK